MRKTETASYSFAAIDFETANYDRDSACAIGVAIVREGRMEALERRLIRPPSQEFHFTHIHGLTWNDVRSAPLFPQVWEDIFPAFSDVDFLVAHNAPFDRSVLNACCDGHRIRRPRQKFECTVKVARSVFGIFPTKLSDVCQELKIPLSFSR